MHPTLPELEAVCQKPQWREVGSLLARRVARPTAVYLTWLAVRWPITANMVTGATLVVGLLAAVLLGLGRAPGFVAGAVVLNLWYLLDHVDGQVARFRRSESVTGVYFDFMMHHLVHPTVAFALGYGLARQTGDLEWTLAGAALALGVSVLSLANDCRYKAFVAVTSRREKGLQIENCKLKIANWPVLRTSDAPSTTEEKRARSGSLLLRPLRVLHRGALRVCEMPNIVIAVTFLAAVVALRWPYGLTCVRFYVGALAVLAPALGLARLAKQVWRHEPDVDFLEFARSVGPNQPPEPDSDLADKLAQQDQPRRP